MGLAYLEQSITLAANEVLEIPLRGRTVGILSLTGSVGMRVDHSEESNVRQGIKFSVPDHFDKLEFREKSGAAATLVVAISEGDIDDNRLTITTTINVKAGDTMATPAIVTAGTAATQLVAADSTRNAVAVQNLHATDNLWIGDANVGNDAGPRGLRLLPGEKGVLQTGAIVYGRRGDATDISVGIMELKT